MKKVCLILFGLIMAVTTNAQSWSVIPSASLSTFYSCSFGDPSTVYVVGDWSIDSATILKSTNAGLSFCHLNASFITPGQMIKSCFFTSADTGFVAGGTYNSTTPFWTAGFIYKTTNGGTSWSPVVAGAATAFQSVYFPGRLVGYATGGFNGTGVIYKTIDGGNTWASIFSSGATPVTINNVWMRNDNSGYVMGSDNTLNQAKCITIGSGTVASNVNFPAYSFFGNVYYKSTDTGFAVGYVYATSGGNYYLLKTTDGGISWNPVYTCGMWGPARINFASQSVGYAIGDTSLITTDGGNTWSGFSPATSATGSIYWMDISNGTGIIVGETGTILRNSAVTSVPSLQNTRLNVALFPNPVTSQTTISFTETQANVTVRINDITGREVKNINFSGKDLVIDKGDMVAGIYIVNIITQGGAHATKMIVQ